MISLFLIGYGDFYSIYVLLGSISFNYLSGIGIEHSNARYKRVLLYFSNVFNLGYLFVFKYFNFFYENILKILQTIGIATSEEIALQILMPLGISFYILQAISYNIEIYRGNIRAEHDILKIALYLIFFPKFLAGPIERPKEFLSQLSIKRRVWDWNRFSEAVELLLMGLFKKVVISNVITYHISQAFIDPSEYSSVELLLIALLYTLQIYSDFSGYSQIARGIAKLFGIDLMKNFNQPYLSRNPQEFWRRWHISFSTWLRDYVYFPLGGSRVKTYRIYINLLIVFFISGIWHGVGFTFMIWGLIHAAYIIIFRAVHSIIKSKNPKLFKNYIFLKIKKITAPFVMFILVTFAWIFFASSSLNIALDIIKKMGIISDYSLNFGIVWRYIFLFMFYSFVLFTIDIYYEKNNNKGIEYAINHEKWQVQAVIYSIILFSLIIFQFETYSPFIYEGF